MEGFTYVDIFATKGFEYLLVIGFLLVLIPLWRFLKASGRLMPSLTEGFLLPESLYYHQGHSWAMPWGKDFLKVGVDDFAQKLVGKPNTLNLPEIGSRIEQGRIGWELVVDSKTINMLSPVTGEVVALNKDVLKTPDLINQDPYGQGWLVIVKPHNMVANIRNLLKGKPATAWMEATMDALRERIGSKLGAVYQDESLPVAGIARVLSPEGWNNLAREFLLTIED